MYIKLTLSKFQEKCRTNTYIDEISALRALASCDMAKVDKAAAKRFAREHYAALEITKELEVPTTPVAQVATVQIGTPATVFVAVAQFANDPKLRDQIIETSASLAQLGLTLHGVLQEVVDATPKAKKSA